MAFPPYHTRDNDFYHCESACRALFMEQSALCEGEVDVLVGEFM